MQFELKLLIFFIIVRKIITTTVPPKVESAECGQYGFRCLNDHSFKICPYKYFDEENDPNEEGLAYECGHGLLCDEDNPAYCSPLDPLFMPERTNQRLTREKNSQSKDTIDPLRSSRGICDCSNMGSIQETVNDMENTTDSKDSDENSEDGKSLDFQCEAYGFYPDSRNQSLFWYCDVPTNGEGYYLRHMTCSQNRLFDPIRRLCVLKGTTRNIRKNPNPMQKSNGTIAEHRVHSNSTVPTTKLVFSCLGKSPGNHSHEKHCNIYYFCSAQSVFSTKVLSCPNDSAFDPKLRKCTKDAKCFCEDHTKNMKSNTSSHGNSKYTTRFFDFGSDGRVRDIKDCKSYFLCYGNSVIQMRCPEFYKFDDYQLQCRPENLARCL